MSAITQYYVRQAQTGSGMNYFAGSQTQKGSGIGSFLGGLFRCILPFLSTGASEIGREAMRAGSHILADAVSGEVPLKTSVRQHFGQAGHNLANKMKGQGIKRRKSKTRSQSTRVTRAGRSSSRKRAKLDNLKHIF